MNNKLLVVLSFLFCYAGGFETRSQGVFGTVTDAVTGEKLPFVSVFLNNTSFATETSLEGQYLLKKIPEGSYSIVFRQVGFKPQTHKISVDKISQLKLDIKLHSDEKLLEEVKVAQKKDKVWERQFELFERQFLGDKYQKNQCRIVNPWVLDFTEDKNVLTAKAKDIVEINNQSLGYQVRYSLNEFRFDGAQVFFSGLAEFTPLYTNDVSQKNQWEQNRAEAYRGSDIHFFKSLQKKTASQEGFEFFVDKPGEDPTKRSSFFFQDQVKKLAKFPLDSLVKSVKSNFSVSLPSRIEVHYKGKEGVYSIYKDKLCQVAWIESNGQPLLFNSQGILLNPQACAVSGYLAENRVSTLLPLDYTPSEATAFPLNTAQKSASEAAYFVTDKPFYFTNDVVQLSGKMVYSKEEGADTLSQLVYVELVHPESNRVMARQPVKLDNRLFKTQIILQDSLIKPATYLVRVYSKWMKNHSDSAFTYRWIPVVKNDEKAEYVPENKRELISMKVEELDDSLVVSLPSEAFSWGVSAVVEGSLPNRSPLTNARDEVGSSPQNWQIERGIGISGVVKNYRSSKHESVLLMIPSSNLSFFAAINEKGAFYFSELPLEGRQNVLLQVMNARGKPVLDASIFLDTLISPKWLPTLVATQWKLTPELHDGGNKREAVQLEEVLVKAKTPPKPISSLYKEADYVLQGKDLYENVLGMNILSAIQGRVPGLRIVELADESGLTKLVITMRMGASAGGMVRTKLPQPLVLVDGTPFDNINLISQIPASQVERVEIVNRAEALLGLRGYVGVISIITKHAGAVTEDGGMAQPKGVQKFAVEGANPRSVPKNGPMVDYWNATLLPSTFSPITSFKVPKPRKKGRYSIYFEGITYGGKPVTSSYVYLVRE